MAVDQNLFKEAMAHFATGVTIVTTENDGERFGMTVAAFASVSLNPPLVLVCVARDASSHGPINASRRFAVHILAADQERLAERFAGMTEGVTDRFEGVGWKRGISGCPILDGVVSVVECEVVQAHLAGDHTLFVGSVLDAHRTAPKDVLLHYDRGWIRLPSRTAARDAE